MSRKTVLRFSKRMLSQLPGIAIDAYSAAGGDVCAWIHTGERVLSAISDTVVMCIHHSTVKKLTVEVETAKRTMQKQFNEAEKAAAASAKATNKTTNPAKTSASSSTSEPKMLDTWHCSVNGDIWATFIENGKVYIKPMRNNWKMPIIHAIDLKKTSDIDALLFFSGNSNDSKEAKGVYIVRRDDAIISPVDSFIEENGKIKVLYSDIDDTKKTLTLPPSTAIRVRCIRYQEDKNKLHFSNNVRWVVSK